MKKVDLKSHADKRVGEREHKVRRDSSAPAPDDQLGEFQRWVVGRRDVLHVDGHVEGKAEEGYNNEIFQFPISIPLLRERRRVYWHVRYLQMRPIETAGMLV